VLYDNTNGGRARRIQAWMSELEPMTPTTVPEGVTDEWNTSLLHQSARKTGIEIRTLMHQGRRYVLRIDREEVGPEYLPTKRQRNDRVEALDSV
jgi:hypothetical protein